jgi:thiol-disulfide isomerase/thioredoxin
MARTSGIFLFTFLLVFTTLTASSQTQSRGPTDPKAQKTYAEAKTPGKHWDIHELIDKYKKADKQDGNHCADCALQVTKLAMKTGDAKLARTEAMELEGLAATPEDESVAHFLHGRAALQLALNDKKQSSLTEADTEFQKVIALKSNDAQMAMVEDGIVLANLHQDEAARSRFHEYLEVATPGRVLYQRAQRYEKNPELARERLAPAFALTTLTGERISLDELQGRVLLIDFWATWCGPCRQALPHMQNIAKKFAGQPLVILSVSLDKDQTKWKEFVAKNHMDWQQYCDGCSEGALAQSFQVRMIPATFTIDSDGVLQDQHVGDADIEGKLKKLVAAAEKREEEPAAAQIN